MCAQLRVTSLAVLFFASLNAITSPALSEIPLRVDGDDSAPLWVAAGEAISGDSVRWDLLPDAAREKIERQLETSRNTRLSDSARSDSDPCWTWYSTKDIEPVPLVGVASPEHLAELAQLMLVGTITDSTLGFYKGYPATVYEVAVERTLKAPESPEIPSSLYVVSLGAAIPIGENYLCFRSSPVISGPAHGRRLLLALEKVPDLEQSRLIWPGDHELFFDSPEGSVALASSYASSASFDELVRSMAEPLSEGTWHESP